MGVHLIEKELKVEWVERGKEFGRTWGRKKMIKVSLNFKNVLNHKNIIRKITKVKDHPPKDCDRTCLRKNPNMGVILKYHIFFISTHILFYSRGTIL